MNRDGINLLFIIADQFRADLLNGALAASVKTPHLDRLADRSSVFDKHHTVAVPCGPARASMLTGLRATTHGAIRNGHALNLGQSNLATHLRRIGREPLLFGYTDTQPNPELLYPRDPAHLSYTGPMEGFTEVVEMRDEAWRWIAYLRAHGYDVPLPKTPDFARLYRPKNGRFGGPALYSAEHSDTAFLAQKTIESLDVRRAAPWSAFVTFIRPHPPFVAPAPYHNMIDPAGLAAPLQTNSTHPFLEVEHASPSSKGMFWGYDGLAHALEAQTIQKIRATYLGLVAELDANIGKLFDWLDSTGQTEKTMIVFTSDHGEMLGDFGLWGKLSPFPQASHVPLMLSGPDIAQHKFDHVTQSTQVMPELLQFLEGGNSPVFAPPETDEGAVVEMALGNPASPTRFQKAWGHSKSDLLCKVQHDATTRVATFNDVVEPLHMNPDTGMPL